MINLHPSTPDILVAGDWHGDFSWASRCLREAKGYDIDTIIQVGDFGYWEHHADGVYFLNKLSENAQLRGVNVIWLDGNHENHTMLREKYADAEKSVEGFWKIRDSIWYSPRANAWEWYGKRLMTLGGAFSIDRDGRVLGKSYWAEEEITPEEEALAKSRGKIDYLFTHDAPTTFPKPLWKVDLNSEAQRQAVSRVADAVRPSYWFHGHYHTLCDYVYPQYDPFCKVQGLDCNGSYNSLRKFNLLVN